jgi:hypothetical protein
VSTEPAFEPTAGERSRDYQDVEEAARQLGGGQAPERGADIHPIEESEDVAAAVDDEAPVPELAEAAEPARSEPREGQDPSSSRSTRSE